MLISFAACDTQSLEVRCTSRDAFTAYLDARIPSLMHRYEIPGVSIALVQNGEMTWSEAYGYADRQTGRKMTTETYCRVESISKSVTAWGVMALVQEGKIELDKPVSHYITRWAFPASDFSEDKVTVRQLLTHTAGMPLGDIFERYSPEDEIPSLPESLSKQATLIQEPGSAFSYSNTGYNLLELMIEEVTGRDFAEYMEDEVLIPLKMDKASFTWSKELNPPVSVGYDQRGNPVPFYIYPEKASGGLLASVEDIAALVAAGMTGHFQTDQQVLAPETVKQLYAPLVEKPGIYRLIFDGYGLGYYLDILPEGRRTVVNGGQGGGVMSIFQAVPETGDGIVILSNSQRSWPFFASILTDWAEWNGFSSIGLEKLLWAQKALWILIGLIGCILSWRVICIIQGLMSGRRRISPLSKESRCLRCVLCSFAILLIVGLLWCRSQPYLFLSAVFPIASSGLGLSILMLAVTLFFSAWCPVQPISIKEDGI